MSYRSKHIKPKIRGLRKRKKFYQTKLFWLFLLIIAVVSTSLYFLLFFPKIQVENIQISGNERVQAQDIEDAAWPIINKEIFSAGIFNISSKSIFTVDIQDLVKSILEKFPEIEDITVQKEFPHIIILKIKERKPFAAFCAASCFLIDSQGVIFQSIDAVPDGTILIKKDSNQDISLGQNAVNKSTMDNIAKVQSNLKNNFQIDIKEVVASDTVIMKTSEGWKAYFDPAGDIKMQIDKLDTLLKNEISPANRKNLQYIYLQYKDKVYYK